VRALGGAGVVPVCAAFLLSTGPGCGCSDRGEGGSGGTSSASSTTSTTWTSATTTTSTNTTTTTSTCDAGARLPCPAECEPKPNPAAVPAGWVEYTDWSCDCRFYVPGSSSAMPPAIAWEACPSSPGGIDCRMMRTDWTSSGAPVDFFPIVFRLSDARPVLGFRRIAEEYLMDLVAEVDGPVHMAVLETGYGIHTSHPRCMINSHDFGEGKYVLGVRGEGAYGDIYNAPDQGALGGDIDQPRPTLLAHYQVQDLGYDWRASASWVGRVNANDFKVLVSPWSMAEDILITSPPADPDNLHIGQWFLMGDAMFWGTSTLKMNGINVWDPVHGARPFIRWIGDYTKGAGDLGTDGIDMVWTYGEKQPNDTVYDPRSVMTAPFTTDPAAVQARRLRSQPYPGLGEYAWKVGCGYAAFRGGGTSTVLVVRLSDGVAWSVPSSPPELEWVNAIGVTCDEVFIIGDTTNGRTTFFRVRLDSLGPGLEPD
jgi:hypothetical protein